GDIAEPFGAYLFGERTAKLLGLLGIHEHPRLLQEHRRAQPRRQDEMTLEQGIGRAEELEDFVLRHVASPSLWNTFSMPAIALACNTLARSTRVRPRVRLSVASTSVSWATSRT